MKKTSIETEKERIDVEDGQIRVILGGTLDLAGFTEDLREKGYFVANNPSDIDSQGWGKVQDMEGYYPYWVYRDDDHWVFAFTPEGFQAKEKKDNHLLFEKDTQAEINYWKTYIEGWCI